LQVACRRSTDLQTRQRCSEANRETGLAPRRPRNSRMSIVDCCRASRRRRRHLRGREAQEKECLDLTSEAAMILKTKDWAYKRSQTKPVFQAVSLPKLVPSQTRSEISGPGVSGPVGTEWVDRLTSPRANPVGSRRISRKSSGAHRSWPSRPTRDAARTTPRCAPVLLRVAPPVASLTPG
jgi:hypothetical protein